MHTNKSYKVQFLYDTFYVVINPKLTEVMAYNQYTLRLLLYSNLTCNKPPHFLLERPKIKLPTQTHQSSTSFDHFNCIYF